MLLVSDAFALVEKKPAAVAAGIAVLFRKVLRSTMALSSLWVKLSQLEGSV